MATALSAACSTSCRCVHYQMLALGGAVRVAPYGTFGTPELAEATLDALEGRMAALMANHGAITHGHDLAAAVENAHLLEWALHASTGAPPRSGRRACSTKPTARR